MAKYYRLRAESGPVIEVSTTSGGSKVYVKRFPDGRRFPMDIMEEQFEVGHESSGSWIKCGKPEWIR